MKALSNFTSSFIFCIIAAIAAYYIGGIPAIITVSFLTILETSLSFDNAVVNAKILNNWDHKWRQRFLIWGMPIAVFGMRLVFPIAIVSIAAHISPISAIDVAINEPTQYQQIISSAHHQIAAFGGTFLMMVFLHFFIAAHKTNHWIHIIEAPLTRLGKMEAIEATITLVALIIASNALNITQQTEFIIAGIFGLITFIIVHGASSLLGGDANGAQHGIVKQGIHGFIYLELIDASFSFDGVIGAFALTNNLFIIMLGLGAGAMFVRSFTLVLVENKTLSRFQYLEHGAFWAIGALATIMLISPTVHLGEMVTGSVGALLIGASFISSILANRKQK